MATVALSGIITPTNVVTATSTTTLTNKTLTGAVMNGTLGATTPSTVVATTVKASTTMGVGAATPSASGSGISFPATQDPSTDANTLDDYEEGTWTCAITTGGGSITMNTSFDTGAYTKVGRLVTITGEFRVSSVSSPSGTAIIALPFTVAAATERSTYPTASLWMESASQNMNTYFIQAGPSTTNMYIYAMGTNSYGNAANNFSGDELLFITMTYMTT